MGGKIKLDFQEGDGVSMDWIDLTQDMDTWLAVVNAVLNFQCL